MVDSRPPANPLFLREEELRHGIELMFYAYRDFTFESDQQLKHYQLGRAHHRALYFIGRHPGQTVGHVERRLHIGQRDARTPAGQEFGSRHAAARRSGHGHAPAVHPKRGGARSPRVVSRCRCHHAPPGRRVC